MSETAAAAGPRPPAAQNSRLPIPTPRSTLSAPRTVAHRRAAVAAAVDVAEAAPTGEPKKQNARKGGRPRKEVTLKMEDIAEGAQLDGTVVRLLCVWEGGMRRF